MAARSAALLSLVAGVLAAVGDDELAVVSELPVARISVGAVDGNGIVLGAGDAIGGGGALAGDGDTTVGRLRGAGVTGGAATGDILVEGEVIRGEIPLVCLVVRRRTLVLDVDLRAEVGFLVATLRTGDRRGVVDGGSFGLSGKGGKSPL